jgi:fibronectin-binding autotransporter adhesin
MGNGLDLTGNDQQSTTFSGNITGTGGEFALFGGGGTLTLTGTSNTYSGPTDIFGSGLVQLGSAMLTLGGDNTSTTFTGGVTGTGGLDKMGTGTFTLTNSGGAFQATYSGPTLIDGGVFQAGAANSFAPNSPVGIAPGATLALNGFNQTIAGLQGAGSVTLGAGTLTDNQASPATYSGVISGSGGLTKGGAGTLTLSGANTYSGTTTVNAGVLQAGAANSFSPKSAVLTNGGTLDLNGFNQTIAGLSSGTDSQENITPATAGAVTLGTGTLTVNESRIFIYGGVISGSGGLTITGSGNLGLLAPQTYTGPTTVNGGTLGLGINQIGGVGSIASSSGLNLAVSGATFDISGSRADQTIKDLTGVAGSSIVLGGSTLTAGTANSTTFSGVISGSGGFSKVGTGTLILGGSNTYSGLTTVNAGVLSGGASNVFSPNSIVSVASGATLDVGGLSGAGGNSQTIAGLSGAGSVSLGQGQLTVNTATGVSTTFSGVMSENPGVDPGITTALTKSGAGTLTLTGVNTYTAPTTINGGTLALSGNGSIASSQSVALIGGTFDVSGVNAITAVQTLFSNSGTTVNVGGKTLIFGGSTPSIVGIPDIFLGSFNGTGGLIYSGTDTALLNGNSAGFTGTLLITAGTVSIGGDFGNVPTAGAEFGGSVTVNPGGTLAGLGTIVGTVNNKGGTVRPGGSIGTLTVNGNYTQAANGTLAIEISPTASSKLAVGGAASLAGTLKLMYDPGVYTTTSYNFLTASSVSGTFGTVVSNNPSGSSQTLVYGPNGVTEQLAVTSPTGVTTQPTVIAPTNDTVYTDLTSTLVLNGQRANAIILDRVGSRASGVADGQVALAGAGVTGLQLAQAGNGAALSDFASALPQALATQGVWFRGLGDFASVDSNGAIPGFTGSAGGFLAGYDRPVAPNIYLGLAGGYLHSNVDERNTGSSGLADTARLAVYGGAFVGPSLLTGTAGWAHDRIETDRPFAGVGTANENHNGNEATVAGQWSLPLQVSGFGQGVATLTPKTGVQYLHLDENAFNETGAAGFDLSSGGHSTDSLQPFVAVSASQKFVTNGGMWITPEVRLGYDREVLSGARTLTVATVTGALFPVTGVKPSKDIFTTGAGLTIDYQPNLALYATYDAIVPTGNTTDQTVEAGLRVRF